jgi:hypothetical protein
MVFALNSLNCVDHLKKKRYVLGILLPRMLARIWMPTRLQSPASSSPTNPIAQWARGRSTFMLREIHWMHSSLFITSSQRTCVCMGVCFKSLVIYMSMSSSPIRHTFRSIHFHPPSPPPHPPTFVPTSTHQDTWV